MSGCGVGECGGNGVPPLSNMTGRGGEGGRGGREGGR